MAAIGVARPGPRPGTAGEGAARPPGLRGAPPAPLPGVKDAPSSEVVVSAPCVGEPVAAASSSVPAPPVDAEVSPVDPLAGPEEASPWPESADAFTDAVATPRRTCTKSPEAASSK